MIQDLFEQYSGLAFTRPSDRSVAILGLQERLAGALRTSAAYGFFAIFFARGLLWERSGARMVRIIQPAGHQVPSWSWFSKTGTIRYMKLKFKGVEWATTDFENPFECFGDVKQGYYEPHVRRDLAVLRGYGRRMIISQRDMLLLARFDGIPEFKVQDLLCVVIGRDKLTSGGSSKRHVILIHQESNADGEELYERVGVASLKPLQIEDEGTWIKIR